ncbi:MAG: hypothetical protein GXO27_05725, partial [Chlorobi bacterium]|nr:hypothetical protein [Chlorobiota bacterium]
MKKKLIVIAGLLALLVWTVREMLKYEEKIRSDHIITKVVEDPSKPLIERWEPARIAAAVKNLEPRFRAGTAYFEVQTEDGAYRPFFLKGVNFGVAVPGKFPAEFSLSFDEYVQWLDSIGRMHANVIRTYTILPPEFYRALAYYNLHLASRPLYLLQGVWATEPPRDDYMDPGYTRDFQKEIKDVIDVIHGQAVLPPRPGKAHGTYTADVSRWTAGLLLGREWEPKAVFHTVRTRSDSLYRGDFVSVYEANPMEVWLARMLDFAARYETQTYGSQRPLSFVNWLPLDPMYHDTEFIENKKVREYDNDLVSVDFAKFHATPYFKAGLYAAYHVYPYYPDFIFLDLKYRPTPQDPDNYRKYLRDLKAHTPGMPLVIAEYGLPNSRGISHFSTSGFHQGGHSEAEQAAKSMKLTRDIVETGGAGAIYFEWIDEWFKHNWLVMDFEIPFEHRKLWHNMENPEQNFGVMAMESKRIVIDGRTGDWKEPPLYASDDTLVLAAADPTYFSMALVLPGIDWSHHRVYIALDTYDKTKGDHRLPFSERTYERGFEFLAALYSPDSAKILVDDPYSVFTDIYNDYIPVYASKPNSNGKFIDQLMLVNRGRESLTGEKFPRIIHNRSPLRFGISTRPQHSNADWYASGDTVELRLDWHLINVSDPSHRYVLDDRPGTKAIEASVTDGFRIKIFVTDTTGKILHEIPGGEEYLFFTWDPWDQPPYTARLKPLYDSLALYFDSLEYVPFVQKSPEAGGKPRIMPFRHGKPAAVSVDFDYGAYSQYVYAYPLLEKYGLRATFEQPEGLTHKTPEVLALPGDVAAKRMGTTQLEELRAKGHGLAAGLF